MSRKIKWTHDTPYDKPEYRPEYRPLYKYILLLLALSSCSSTTIEPIQEKSVVHVVFIWLKEPGNKKHIQQVIEVSKQLKEIPYIQEMRVGKSISSNRQIVDDSFDIGLYMIFSNKQAMQQYLVHTEHKNAVKNILKPLASKIQVYDFKSVER